MLYVVPETLRRSFFLTLHNNPLGAHQGINRTLLHLQNRYFWPNMVCDIKLWCAQCHVCVKSKRLPINRKSPLQQQISGAPFERIAVDLMGPFEKTGNDNLYIAVFQDYFSKWVIAEPIKDKTAIAVADVFYTKWIALFGCPQILHSDRGGEFKADIIARLCDLLRIKKTFTSTYRPESDGMLERSMRTIQALLRAFVNKARDDWDDHLPAVLCAYRATPHDSTGLSPFKMLFGHEVTLPIDLQFDVGLRDRFPECPVEYVEWLRQTLYLGHDLAREKLKVAAERQKKGYQETCREVSFKRGDWVWKIDPLKRVGKLHVKNLGPYLVIAKTGPVNYQIQENENARLSIVHVDKLYPYTKSDNEVLLPWIAPLPEQLDMASQADALKPEQLTTGCQTDSVQVGMTPHQTPISDPPDCTLQTGPITMTPPGSLTPGLDQPVTPQCTPPQDGTITISIDQSVSPNSTPQQAGAGANIAPSPVPAASPDQRRSKRTIKKPARFRHMYSKNSTLVTTSNCLAKAVLQLSANFAQ